MQCPGEVEAMCLGDYQERLVELLRCFSASMRQHIEEIEKTILTSAGVVRQSESNKAKDRQSKFNREWKPEFERLYHELSGFNKDLERKPSLCVMGRRGAGKTTLLKSWLGKTDTQEGMSVLKRLPHGREDTTACLVRLSASKTPPEETVLDISLLPRDVMPEVEQRPLRPDSDSFRVLAAFDDSNPYRLCRFPVGGQDDCLYLKKNGDRYVVGEDGETSLESVQWHTREVRIPLDISLPGMGMAGEVFAEVDLVDSPGADPTQQGSYGEWKKRKNSQVFMDAVKELDMLLLVISSNVSAINLGNQFQKDIWHPWSARCEGRGEGRLMIVFSHATEILKPAVRKLNQGDEQDDDLRNDSFGRMLYKNVFLPLFWTGDGVEKTFSILDEDDISTWPPFFFYDSDCDWLLEKFKGDFVPGSGEEKAVHLSAVMAGTKRSEGLSDAERCILDLAGQCDDIRYENPNVDTMLLKRWVIRSLCAFFDPADRGLGLLTRYVVEYGSRGLAAKNHVWERVHNAENLYRSYITFLEKMAEPSTNLEAVRALREASSEMRRLWGIHPAGPRLRLGKNSKVLMKVAEVNLRPGQEKKTLFEQDKILSDAVDDALVCTDLEGKNRSEETTAAVRSVLKRCLSSDFALSRHFERKKGLLCERPDELKTFLSVVLERMPRVMEHLKNASEEQLGEIAKVCFEIDIANTDLLRPVLDASLEKKCPKVADALKEARCAFGGLEAFLAENPIHLPFSVPELSADMNGQHDPFQQEEVCQS